MGQFGSKGGLRRIVPLKRVVGEMAIEDSVLQGAPPKEEVRPDVAEVRRVRDLPLNSEPAFAIPMSRR
jgi:hypothetical protein